MSETVTVSQAKDELCDLLRRASEGETFTVTRRGKPVAQILPPGRPDRETVEATIRRMREQRKGRTLGGISVKELIREGRP